VRRTEDRESEGLTVSTKKEYVVGFLTYGAGPNLMVALQMKNNPAMPWMVGRWNGVGGAVEGRPEYDEGLEDWMECEFREATGMASIARDWKIRASLEWPDVQVVHVLHCQVPSWVELPEFRAEEPVQWFRVDALPAYVLDDVRWLLPLCLDDRVRFPVRVFMNQQVATVASQEPT
jgi:hypothetical protein